jgi:outer membrane protein OmpA-like peptidoglycan-associated protein
VRVAPPPPANPAPEPPPPPPVLAERAPAPPPPTSAAPAAAAPGPQVATAPATGATRAGNRLRLVFDGTSSELSDSAKQELQQLAADLTKQGSTRIQLLAYAEGTPTTLSQARRLSLDRALTVRSYLANQGVNTTRIDVRALGNQTENGAPANRVDLMVMQE